jgi:hypothetical protein
MRSMLFCGLTFLVAAGVAAGADKPIPQDTARMERHRRESREWNLRTMQGAYDKVGKKNPRWDKPAREAMDLASRMFSQQVDPIITFKEIHQAAKSAVDAGCDDPFLVYLFHRSAVGPNFPGEEEAIRRMSAASKSLAASRYPAFRRASVLVIAGGFELYTRAPSEAFSKDGRRYYDAILALLPESVAGDERNEFWEDKWFDTANESIRAYRKLGMDAIAAYERVDAKLAKVPELKALRLKVRGSFWYSYGWEARTTAFAGQVPKDGFEKLETRLVEARKALLEAWKLKPDDARTADYLLNIDKSIGGDRATMELWFDRAMKADGDMVSSCRTKLDWLDPKWHGTPEEMLAFGKACRETKNWKAGITLLACDAHLRFVCLQEPEGRFKYLGSPKVWSEIKSVYDEYLKHYPNDDVVRGKYATLGYIAAHYPEAHAQFELVGDRLAVWPDSPNYPLESMKGMRKFCKVFVGGMPREDIPKGDAKPK